MKRYRQIRLAGLLLTAALAGLVYKTANPPLVVPAKAGPVEVAAPAAPSIETYETTRTVDGFRVTLLGVTKGMAFRETPSLVDSKALPPGRHAVPWMRVAVLIEAMDAKGWLGDAALSLDARTGNDDRLVEPMTVEWYGHSMPISTGETAHIDLDFQELKPMLYPTAPPKVEHPERSRILAFTLSGHFRPAEIAHLTVRLDQKGTKSEFTFEDVPMP